MKLFLTVSLTAVAVLLVCFVGWIAARAGGDFALAQSFGRVMLYDFVALGVVGGYVAFVGAWHVWERLTGRMELEADRQAGGDDPQVPPRPAP